MMKNTIVLLFVACVSLGFSQESLELSSQSTLIISGTSSVHDWTVAAKEMTGKLTALENTPTEIIFEIMVVDIQSERGAAMDKKMHAALKKEQHPKIDFKLQEVKGKSIIIGILNIAGVSKEVEIDSEITSLTNGIQIKGEKKISLQYFDIEPPTAMFGQIIVGNDVTIFFDLIFEKE